MFQSKPMTDHLGNTYESLAQMCKHYHISSTTFLRRIHRSKWSLEKALTTPCRPQYVDHRGRCYTNLCELARAHNLNPTYTRQEYNKGRSCADITANPPISRSKKVMTDHLGNQYESIRALCHAYQIDRNLFYSRYFRYGWSMKKALTTPTRQRSNTPMVVDHLNQAYPSQKAMCDYYQIGVNTFVLRKKQGWDLEKALTTPVKKRRPRKQVQKGA